MTDDDTDAADTGEETRRARRGASLRKRRRTPRRRVAPREDRAWWQEATMTLLARCGYLCERCGQPLGDNLERHHRQRREVGGDRLANLMALHSVCHRYITEHPAEAEANGWIVSAHGPDGTPDPALVKVRIRGFWWLLTDDGRKTPLP